MQYYSPYFFPPDPHAQIFVQCQQDFNHQPLHIQIPLKNNFLYSDHKKHVLHLRKCIT